ncbi:SRPBCC family protein [Pontixanthobacter aquaemixtae]|uniref:Uncharacterized protein n=1 Tax=Pontixanthobacter aquaemixtae TaxID=1958940 RepID=A0A844ZSU8_9SPHN|nr:hypothetical protein [Pontixanthobacter aquaemixtae]MXO90798.1 hypothetical protein [Pontixanthobacter aquaemixtae]
MPVTARARAQWGEGTYHFARFVDEATPVLSAERDQSIRFGIYHLDAQGSARWIIPPEYSGLFAVNSDLALVRKPGKDTWYALSLPRGKLQKLGEGYIRVKEMADRDHLVMRPYFNLYRYYLASDDDGSTQTVRLLRWDTFKNNVRVNPPIPNVISPGRDGERAPVIVLPKHDNLVRVALADGTVEARLYDGFLFWKKKSYPSVDWARTTALKGNFAVSYPSGEIFKVIDAERQLFMPYSDAVVAKTVYGEWGLNADKDRQSREQYQNLLGMKPIGLGVTVESKDEPLLHFPESVLAAVWQTPQGIRLAPYFRNYYTTQKCDGQDPYRKMGECQFPLATMHQLEARYHYDLLGGTKQLAQYIALDPIAVPEALQRAGGNAQSIVRAAVRATRPDGTIDIIAYTEGMAARGGYGLDVTNRPILFRNPVILNPKPLSGATAADSFTQEAFGPEGRAFFARNMRAAVIAQHNRSLTPEQLAAGLARRERERQAFAERQRVLSETRAALARRDWALARALVQQRTGYSEEKFNLAVDVYSSIIEAGRADLLDDGEVTTAYEGRINSGGTTSAAVTAEYRYRFPPQPVQRRYNPWAASSTIYASRSSARPPSGPTAGDVIQGYMDRSQMRYLAGKSSSYMCGSSSFCR